MEDYFHTIKKNFKNYLNFKNDEERIINSFWEIQKVQKKI